jgi:hypothetical protein
VEFPSLLVSAFSVGKSLSGTGRGFWYVGGGLFSLFVQHSASEFLSLFRRLFCFAHEAPSCPDSMLLGWRLSLISLYVAAYMWDKPVNSACPSRNTQRVCLSASALSPSCFHLAPFPFTLEEFWTSCPIWTVGALTRSVSFFAPGWSAINFSYVSPYEVSTARQRVSHWVR